jgi:hypothetical protein
MNEEALQYSFELFTNDGYEGTIEEYKELLKNDQEALDYSYDLFSKDGYDGEKQEYNKLIGAVQEDTQDFPTAVATETAPVTADATAEDTDLALVDTSLESQKKNVISPDGGMPSIYNAYQEYADKNIPVNYNFDNPAAQFIVDKLAAFTAGTTELLAGVGDFAEMVVDAPVQSAISAYNYFADDENDVTQQQRNAISGVIEGAFVVDDILRVASEIGRAHV